MSITPEQRQTIRELAGDCCEYCRVAQDSRLSKFQVDHIIPIKHGGRDDPATGEATKLYDPRRQQWEDHFQINADATLIGISPEGRATVVVLRLNEVSRVEHRRMAMLLGEYPCKKD